MSSIDKDVKIATSVRIEEKVLNKIKAEAERRKRSVAFIINEKLKKAYETSKKK